METIYLLIGCSVVVAAAFLGAFMWSVRSGQFDDLDTPAVRVLFEDALPQDQPAKPPSTS